MNREKDLTAALRRSLDQCRQEIDRESEERLAAARRRALSATEKKRFRPTLLVPAAAMAMAAMAMVFTLKSRPVLPPDAEVADIEIISSGEDPDFYDQIDFYAWLAESGGDT